jgi:hypothetical protein
MSKIVATWLKFLETESKQISLNYMFTKTPGGLEIPSPICLHVRNIMPPESFPHGDLETSIAPSNVNSLPHFLHSTWGFGNDDLKGET